MEPRVALMAATHSGNVSLGVEGSLAVLTLLTFWSGLSSVTGSYSVHSRILSSILPPTSRCQQHFQNHTNKNVSRLCQMSGAGGNHTLLRTTVWDDKRHLPSTPHFPNLYILLLSQNTHQDFRGQLSILAGFVVQIET